MRRRNGFATVWDLATGTRVVIKPRCAERPVIEVEEEPEVSVEEAVMVGPYPVVEEIVPGEWIAAYDPILRRRVWLRRRAGSAIAPARRDLARPGRSRWLHNVETPEANWDVFESQAGVPLRSLIAKEGHLPWESMRHWLHDLASEIALAAHDETLPPELSLDHVWITARGPAVLLDEPWPKTDDPAERIPVGDLAASRPARSAEPRRWFLRKAQLPRGQSPFPRNQAGHPRPAIPRLVAAYRSASYSHPVHHLDAPICARCRHLGGRPAGRPLLHQQARRQGHGPECARTGVGQHAPDYSGLART
jgi:hypothetical protein